MRTVDLHTTVLHGRPVPSMERVRTNAGRSLRSYPVFSSQLPAFLSKLLSCQILLDGQEHGNILRLDRQSIENEGLYGDLDLAE